MMSARYKSLQASYPKEEIEKHECYVIRGELLVDRRALASIMNVSDRTTKTWQKEGMEESIYSKKRVSLFSVDDVRAWHSKNKGKNKIVDLDDDDDAPSVYDSLDDEVIDIEGKIRQANKVLQIKSTSSDDADRVLKIMTALIKSIEAGKQSKELIPKKDVEKIILEMVSLKIGGYKNDIKILPKDCVGRTEEEIKDILEKNFRGNIENFQKLLKTETDGHVYDVVHLVQELILYGINVSEIITALRLLKVSDE